VLSLGAIAAVASALGFLAASLVAAVGAAEGRARLLGLARGLAIGATVPLLGLLSRPAAAPFVAFAAVAAFPGPQPVALALAAGAALLAGLLPLGGTLSIALALTGAAAALAAHAVGRSLSAHLAGGRDPALPASLSGAAACGLVIALDGGHAWRWDYGVLSGTVRVAAPDAGLLLGFTLLSSLAGALLLGADAAAVSEEPIASPLARMLGRRALLLGSGLALIAAGLVLRAGGWAEGLTLGGAADLAALVAAGALLAGAVPALLADHVSGDTLDDQQSATVISRMVVVVTLAAALAAGAEGWLRSGSYLMPLTERLLSASLIGFAAAETAHFRVPARVLALLALGVALLR